MPKKKTEIITDKYTAKLLQNMIRGIKENNRVPAMIGFTSNTADEMTIPFTKNEIIERLGLRLSSVNIDEEKIKEIMYGYAGHLMATTKEIVSEFGLCYENYYVPVSENSEQAKTGTLSIHPDNNPNKKKALFFVVFSLAGIIKVIIQTYSLSGADIIWEEIFEKAGSSPEMALYDLKPVKYFTNDYRKGAFQKILESTQT
jgi:hypothetical protein